MDDKQTKIDIPDSIESYSVTLFWGLTIKQIVLMFVATLFVGFGVFSIVARNYATLLLMLIMASLTMLGMVEVKGRNFFRYLLFIFTYYKAKPRVLIYHHYQISGQVQIQKRQLVYQKENNNKLLVIMFISLIVGIIVLVLTGIHLYHVAH